MTLIIQILTYKLLRVFFLIKMYILEANFLLSYMYTSDYMRVN